MKSYIPDTPVVSVLKLLKILILVAFSEVQKMATIVVLGH